MGWLANNRGANAVNPDIGKAIGRLRHGAKLVDDWRLKVTLHFDYVVCKRCPNAK